ncbi:Uncharacterized protein SCF082_LOCUS47873 [Durusdinium trenchii]|uniref:Uncharacterized protein n=1 Tax=Durusdinium trenchii TaxID=1381693 RepID=A0ABP0RT95_9DINO
MAVRRSYAGVLRGTCFERRYVHSLHELSEADQEAIVQDIISDRIRKIQELTEKIEQRNQQNERNAEREAIEAEEKELQMEKHRQERLRRASEAFKVFAQRTDAETKSQKAQAAQLVAELRQKDAEAKEKAAAKEAQRILVQRQRLAHHRRLQEEADRAVRARRAQIKANAERRAAALADVPEVLPRPKRPATATGVGLGVGLDGAAIARQQGLSRFADSLDSAHGYYLGTSRPKSAKMVGLRRTRSAPHSRPKSACIACGAPCC